MVVVFGLSFAAYARRGGFWSPELEAQVTNERERGRRQGERGNDQRRVFAFQGEVYSEAEQLRETAALAVSTSLVAIQRVAERRPYPSVESLLAGVIETGSLPPGLTRDLGTVSVSSEQAVYYIRYRAEPLGVEVLSVAKAVDNGAAMVVRLPDDGFAENALTYYVVPKTGAELPGAFVPPAQLIKAGWHPESFKATAVSPSEQQRQREWLAARGDAAR